ncbi:MAG: TonB family protein [Cloacibacillus sp.]
MTYTCEAHNRWAAAVVFSIALNAAVLLLIGCCELKAHPEPTPIMTVSLADYRAAASRSPKAAQHGGARPVSSVVPKSAVPEEKRKRQIQQTDVNRASKKMENSTKDELPVSKAMAAETSAQQVGDEGAPASENAGGVGSEFGGASAAGDGRAAGDDGGGVFELSGLTVLKKVLPDYPLFSRKRKEEGTSVVLAALDNGAVVSAELERSSGFERLDSAALKAVKGWKFHSDGRLRVRIPFAFKIAY